MSCTGREVKTEQSPRSPLTDIYRVAHIWASSGHALPQGFTVLASCIKLLRIFVEKHSIVSCPIAMSWVCLLILFAFLLVDTECGAHCADARSGSWFGSMVEQSPHIGYESKSLIEISSEHAQISFAGETVSPPTFTTFSPLLRLMSQKWWENSLKLKWKWTVKPGRWGILRWL